FMRRLASPQFFFFYDTPTTNNYTLSLHDALPISPAEAIFMTANAIAAIPDDVPTAATPPSSSAILFSKTSTVGFIIRLYIFPDSLNENNFSACAESSKTYEVV